VGWLALRKPNYNLCTSQKRFAVPENFLFYWAPPSNVTIAYSEKTEAVTGEPPNFDRLSTALKAAGATATQASPKLTRKAQGKNENRKILAGFPGRSDL